MTMHADDREAGRLSAQPSPSSAAPPRSGFAARLAAVVAAAVGVVAAWYLRELFLLIFAALLFASLLAGAAGLLSNRTPLPYRAALLVACAVILALAMVFGIFLGAGLRTQLAELWRSLPQLLAPMENWLDVDAEEWLSARAEAVLAQTTMLSNVLGFSSAVAGVITNIVLVVVSALYLAFHPAIYVSGFVHLFPSSMRGKVRRTLARLGAALQRWMIGQLFAMLVVGLLTYLGLRLLGMPSALALAAIAALFEFIPFLGPLLAAVPALAIAVSESPSLAISVAALYLAIQQAEGNLITPLVQQRWVRLPPAVTLFSILAFGTLFGWLGILLATPLGVAAMIMIQELWLAQTLHEEEAGAPASTRAIGSRRA